MNFNSRYISISIFSLLIGVAFYFFVRGYVISPKLILANGPVLGAGSFANSFPSFIHAFAFILLSVGIGFNPRKAAYAWLFLGFVFEFMQLIFSFGTFDIVDLAAIAAGVACAFLICHRFSMAAFSRPLLYSAYVLGLLTSVATSKIKEHKPSPGPKPIIPESITTIIYSIHDPIYMSYEDLRQSFAVEQPRPVSDAGKILVVGTTLLISEPNVGVHVFDNIDPANPAAKYFLNIPGNVDLAAKNGIIYADSFIDLVAIRIDNEKPELTHRVEDTFPWNPYQAIKDQSVRFDQESLDKERGVIIGSRPKVGNHNE